jgi:hypothetical protein
MKKLIVLAFLVTASLAACGNKNKAPATTAPKSDAKMEPAPTEGDAAKKPDGDMKKTEGGADPCAAPK